MSTKFNLFNLLSLTYGALYGNCYWSNMIYSKLKLTMRFGQRHSFYAYTGPMFAAVQDNLGSADRSGNSKYKATSRLFHPLAG